MRVNSSRSRSSSRGASNVALLACFASIMSCACHIANSQYLFTYEINQDDNSRLPKSSLFNPSAFKIVTPSQLQSTYQRLSTQVASVQEPTTPVHQHQNQHQHQHQHQQEQHQHQQHESPAALNTEQSLAEHSAPLERHQQQSLSKQTSAAIQSFAELFSLVPQRQPLPPTTSASFAALPSNAQQQQRETSQQQQQQVAAHQQTPLADQWAATTSAPTMTMLAPTAMTVRPALVQRALATDAPHWLTANSAPQANGGNYLVAVRQPTSTLIDSPQPTAVISEQQQRQAMQPQLDNSVTEVASRPHAFQTSVVGEMPQQQQTAQQASTTTSSRVHFAEHQPRHQQQQQHHNLHKSAEESLMSFRQEQQAQQQHRQQLQAQQQQLQQQQQQQPRATSNNNINNNNNNVSGNSNKFSESEIPKVSPQIYESFLLQQKDQHEKHLELLKQQQELNKLLEEQKKKQEEQQQQEAAKKRQQQLQAAKAAEAEREKKQRALELAEAQRKRALEKQLRREREEAEQQQQQRLARQRAAEEEAKQRAALEEAELQRALRERDEQLARQQQLKEEQAKKARELELQAKKARELEEHRKYAVYVRQKDELRKLLEMRQAEENERNARKQQLADALQLQQQQQQQQQQQRAIAEQKSRQQLQFAQRHSRPVTQQARLANAVSATTAAIATPPFTTLSTTTTTTTTTTSTTSAPQRSVGARNRLLGDRQRTKPLTSSGANNQRAISDDSLIRQKIPLYSGPGQYGPYRSSATNETLAALLDSISLPSTTTTVASVTPSTTIVAATTLAPATTHSTTTTTALPPTTTRKYDSIADLSSTRALQPPANSPPSAVAATQASRQQLLGAAGDAISSPVLAAGELTNLSPQTLSSSSSFGLPPTSTYVEQPLGAEPQFDDDVPRRPVRELTATTIRRRSDVAVSQPSAQVSQRRRSSSHVQFASDESFARPTTVSNGNSNSNSNGNNNVADNSNSRNSAILERRQANIGLASLPADSDNDGIPGRAGVEYPVLSAVPATSFSCSKQPLNGYYADTETACQVVHLCQGGSQSSILCPNGTIFNQEKFSCQWWYEVNCSRAPNFYALNDNLYKNNNNNNNNGNNNNLLLLDASVEDPSFAVDELSSKRRVRKSPQQQQQPTTATLTTSTTTATLQSAKSISQQNNNIA